MHNRFGRKIRILLNEVQNGTNIRIYEDSVINIDAWFIDRLLNAVSKRITFSSQIKIDAVRDIDRCSTHGLSRITIF